MVVDEVEVVLGGAVVATDDVEVVVGAGVVVVLDVVAGGAVVGAGGAVDAADVAGGRTAFDSQPRADGARTGSMCMPSFVRHGLQALGPVGQR